MPTGSVTQAVMTRPGEPTLEEVEGPISAQLLIEMHGCAAVAGHQVAFAVELGRASPAGLALI